MKEALSNNTDIYKTGSDPRPEFLNDRIVKTFSEGLSEYSVYWDEKLNHAPTPPGYWGEFPKHALYAAQAKLCGIEPQNPKLFQDADYSLLNFCKEYGIPDPNRKYIPDAHRKLLTAGASGKILGAFIDYDEHTKQNLQESIEMIRQDELRKIWMANDWYWNLLPFAKILDLNVSIERNDYAQIYQSLEFAQMRTMNEFYPPDDPDFSTIHLWWYGSLASSIAQARILGIDIPVYNEIVEGIKETARKQSLEGHTIEGHYISTVSNLAIISAKDIKVGGEKGLELYF